MNPHKVAELDYLRAVHKTLYIGIPYVNERTGQKVRSIFDLNLKYRCSQYRLPVLTTKKVNYRGAIAEVLGYLKGYSSAADFRKLGTKTWDANANENQQWLVNPARKGTDDLGRVYGVQGRAWQKPDGNIVDQLMNVAHSLKQGNVTRREIITYWNPGELGQMALPPCMYLFNYYVDPVNKKLSLKVVQRSGDMLLGVPYNMIQACIMLYVMAAYTGLKPGRVSHSIVDAHMYENQVQPYLDNKQWENPVSKAPKVQIPVPKEGQAFVDYIGSLTVDDFIVTKYKPGPVIKYPFSV